MSDTGNGGAITIAGWSGDVVDITPTAIAMETLDDSLLSTTEYATHRSADLADRGEITVGYYWDSKNSENLPTIGGAPVAVTLTYPLQVSGQTAASLAGNAIITSIQEPSFVNNELQRGEITVKWDCKPKPTYTPETTT